MFNLNVNGGNNDEGNEVDVVVNSGDKVLEWEKQTRD